MTPTLTKQHDGRLRQQGENPRPRVSAVFRDYLTLTKPRIVLLLLFTALMGMFLASGGPPDFRLAAIVMLAGALASGGANALNHFLDRDIDAQMRRTSRRPVAAQRVRPRQALVFGIAANLIAFVLFATLVNLLSAALALSSTLFYVFVYTMNLKRTTPRTSSSAALPAPYPRHRMDRRHRQLCPPRPLHVRHRILLDSTPLLGIVSAA